MYQSINHSLLKFSNTFIQFFSVMKYNKPNEIIFKPDRYICYVFLFIILQFKLASIIKVLISPESVTNASLFFILISILRSHWTSSSQKKSIYIYTVSILIGHSHHARITKRHSLCFSLYLALSLLGLVFWLTVADNASGVLRHNVNRLVTLPTLAINPSHYITTRE